MLYVLYGVVFLLLKVLKLKHKRFVKTQTLPFLCEMTNTKPEKKTKNIKKKQNKTTHTHTHTHTYTQIHTHTKKLCEKRYYFLTSKVYDSFEDTVWELRFRKYIIIRIMITISTLMFVIVYLTQASFDEKKCKETGGWTTSQKGTIIIFSSYMFFAEIIPTVICFSMFYSRIHQVLCVKKHKQILLLFFCVCFMFRVRDVCVCVCVCDFAINTLYFRKNMSWVVANLKCTNKNKFLFFL